MRRPPYPDRSFIFVETQIWTRLRLICGTNTYQRPERRGVGISRPKPANARRTRGGQGSLHQRLPNRRVWARCSRDQAYDVRRKCTLSDNTCAPHFFYNGVRRTRERRYAIEAHQEDVGDAEPVEQVQRLVPDIG